MCLGEAASNPDLGRLVETELSRAQLTAYLTNDDSDRYVPHLLRDIYYAKFFGKGGGMASWEKNKIRS